ncbi:hypothetical protein TRVA0_051S00122 [Trichomonascus vanleenenianus]|uniref:uncharacterized protein n=1 Tax=Trichomonascus vanleenenianus TaxID=2268995 RepID=UPI003ECA50A8
MTKFLKPKESNRYEALALEAAVKALTDAGITYDEVEMAYAAYCYGDSTSGQRALYQLGMTGIPIVNVNNNCSTGSTALYQARMAVAHGVADCVLCLGFEKMETGSLKAHWSDRTAPTAKLMAMTAEVVGADSAPFACQLFGNAGTEYCDRFAGGNYEAMPKIAEINHRHSAKNPYSQFNTMYTLDQVKKSPCIYGNITKLQCCPTSDGAAAVVVVSERFLRAHPDIQGQEIEIAGQAMYTDTPATFDRSCVNLIGFDMAKKAAEAAYSQAGIAPKDVQVVELHDCFSANELVSLDALGLCQPGKASELVLNGDITYGGRYVVNPSGGLISKGHPLGATGLAQCAELVWHLRGWATNRAVENTRHCLQHNVGLGGAVVVTIYKRPDSSVAPQNLSVALSDGRSRLGYNPAVEARPVTLEMLRKVQSTPQSNDYILLGAPITTESSL